MQSAVEGFSNVLRHETSGTNIRILVHRPGTVATEFHERRNEYDGDRVKATYGGQCPLDPNDIAEGVLWQCMQPERISVILIETFGTAQRSLYEVDHEWVKRNGE